MKSSFVWIALIAITASAAAQGPEAPDALTGSSLTGSLAGDILYADLFCAGTAGAGLSAAFVMTGAFGSDGRLPPWERLLAGSMTEAADIPLIALKSPQALGDALIGAGLLGAEALNAAMGGLPSMSNYFFWTRVDFTMFRMYSSYAEARGRSPYWKDTGFKKRGLLELYGSILDPGVYREPAFWAAVGASAGFFLGTFFMDADLSQAPWSTGSSYIGEKAVHPLLSVLGNVLYATSYALTVGVGEEAMYRGILYEELKAWTNPMVAKAIDTGAFAVMHLVTDLVRGYDWKYILMHQAAVIVPSLCVEWMYDRGGLGYAVATHAWEDIIALNFQFLAFSGVPASQRTWQGAGL